MRRADEQGGGGFPGQTPLTMLGERSFYFSAQAALSCFVATTAVAHSAIGTTPALTPEPAPPRVLDTIPARAGLEERGVRLIGDYKA